MLSMDRQPDRMNRLGPAEGGKSSGCSRLQRIKKVVLLDLAQLQVRPQTVKRIISRRGSKKTC